MHYWICIPVFNRIELTLNCLATLHAQSLQNFTVVICDHGSTDGSTEQIKARFPATVLINASNNLWWTGAINLCVAYVLEHADMNDYLLTLNNDTELPPDYLAEFANHALKYPHAVLSSVVHDIKTGELVSIGFRQNWLAGKAIPVTFEHDHLPTDLDVIEITHASGRGTLFPVSVFQQLGLYDEQHLPHYGADYDQSYKAKRIGYAVYVCRKCRVLSYIDATGMTAVRDKLSYRSFINYFTSIRSPANLKVRWWFGWNNCPKILFPSFITLDLLRVFGSYFKFFIANPK